MDQLLAVGEEAPALEDKERLAEQICEHAPEATRPLVKRLVRETHHRGCALLKAEDGLMKAQSVIEQMEAEPLFPAVYIGPDLTSKGIRVRVQIGNTLRSVRLFDEIDINDLKAGDEVLLSSGQNLVVDVIPDGGRHLGEVGHVDHVTSDGRVAVKSREEVHFALAADKLKPFVSELKEGDLVRWDPNLRMAFEKLADNSGEEHVLKEISTEMDRSRIGGQDYNLDKLISVLSIPFVDLEMSQKFDLSGENTIALVGPPGVGKTLMLNVAMSEIYRLSGQRCLFAEVKPGAFESEWHGVTGRNIREFFAYCRRAAETTPVVIYMDEAENNGRVRGIRTNVHGDKAATAIMREVEGLIGRGNVAIVIATNRPDLLDPALKQRFSEQQVFVGRPGIEAAREIFAIHLKESLPYSPNGAHAAATRSEMIETAVSRFYSCGPETDLCTLKFRDGSTRTIKARELASGRTFAQISKAARILARERAIRGGDCGLRVSDVENAVSDAIYKLSTDLSPANCHANLADLPQDIDVVAVQPIVRKVTRPQRYMTIPQVAA